MGSIPNPRISCTRDHLSSTSALGLAQHLRPSRIEHRHGRKVGTGVCGVTGRQLEEDGGGGGGGVALLRCTRNMLVYSARGETSEEGASFQKIG